MHCGSNLYRISTNAAHLTSTTLSFFPFFLLRGFSHKYLTKFTGGFRGLVLSGRFFVY
jgi:hypothetical protein